MKSFFFYRKEKNGRWTKFESLALVLLSFIVFSLSFCLSLSLSLSLLPFLRQIHFLLLSKRERERGGGLDTIDVVVLVVVVVIYFQRVVQ